MPPITTLELPVGTDLALDTGNRFTRWTRTELGFRDADGNELEEFFFTGWLEEGKLYLRDFSPPQAGDWFLFGRRNWYYLVGRVVENKARCLIFRGGEFYDTDTVDDIQDTMTRCEPPDWVGPAPMLTALAVKMTYLDERAQRLAERESSERYLRRELDSALTYLTTARGRLT